MDRKRKKATDPTSYAYELKLVGYDGVAHPPICTCKSVMLCVGANLDNQTVMFACPKCHQGRDFSLGELTMNEGPYLGVN